MHITRSIRTLLFAAAVLTMSVAASAQIRISVGFGPPAIPVYEQPVCPGDGYLWTPGYWAWDGDDEDYYWVPGTWVEAPEVGYLWTPPWWGWDGGVFLFHEGFWGPHIGFYGGINYGFGYFGEGFVGGRWDGGHFFYNRDVVNVNVTNIHNVYNEHVTIVNNSHVAFNGGEGGISARPSPEQEAVARDRHVGPVAAQSQHIQEARGNRDLRASVNQGRPAIAATARPGDFHGGTVAAREAGAPYHAPARTAAPQRPENGARPNENGAARSYTHPNELPAQERPAAPNSGNARADQKYQKQQQKLMDQQNKDRQKLQAQQDKEHAQLARQNANEQQKQQVEQRHAQQTQQLQQRHAQQTQNLQSRQAPREHK